MEKVAIPTQGKNVSPHFGHCDGFTIFVIDKNEVKEQSFIFSPPHQPGLLPQLLREKGVNTVIAGGMGGGAINLFEESEIKVITGATGPVQSTIDLYLKDELVSTTEVCHDHIHADSCNGH